jgi:hypothetical protein
MKDWKDEILTALPGLLNPELHAAAGKAAAAFSPESIMRHPLIARLVGAGGSWAEAQGNLIMRLFGNFIEFMGNKLPEKSNELTAQFGDWRGQYFKEIPARLRAAAANGTLAEEKARIAEEIAAMREIQTLLYPPEMAPPPFDWKEKFTSALSAFEARATPAMTKFANWAETLPGARPKR